MMTLELKQYTFWIKSKPMNLKLDSAPSLILHDQECLESTHDQLFY